MFNRSSSINNNPNDDLNDHIASINSYEKTRKNICDDIKKIIKCLYDLNSIEKKFIDNLSSLNREDEKFTQLIQCWNELLQKSLENRQDLAISINHTVGEPMKKFQIAFHEMKSAIKRYEQLTNECNKCSQKLQELKRLDRTSNVIVKQNRYEALLKQSEKDRKSLRQTLERELPLFLEKRIDYFQPSFAAFICSGILYSGLNLSTIDQSNHELFIGPTDSEQQQLFNTINNLSIISS
ncbi:bridging integrator 3 [Dermatophagoides farinae]|uniref:Uncharacterized protein n=1 Tax=Dermatophagoides farinae TaxID=6954 RepID=A0A9D4P0Q4_DERFA|nr:bridging integrator 3-like [Dermatophagoides farinae]KAH7642626.1 hypothetical protein HUG17_5673 [Dermatophagoides farinae]